MNNKLKELIQPYWVEEQQGVYIPLIDKVLLKNNVPEMSYYDYMEYAKSNGVQIATKDELLQMYLQRDQINKILEEHNGDIFNAWVGSSSEYNSYNMKQFNIEEYKKNPNRKVITRDGRSVRIVCTDMIGTYTVVAICKMNPICECCYSYTDDGKHHIIEDTHLDLFFAPEKKEGWLNLYKDEDGRVAIGTVYPIESEKSAKMASEDKDYVATCKIEWEE